MNLNGPEQTRLVTMHEYTNYAYCIIWKHFNQVLDVGVAIKQCRIQFIKKMRIFKNVLLFRSQVEIVLNKLSVLNFLVVALHYGQEGWITEWAPDGKEV